MNYNIIELEFQLDSDGSSQPLFKVVDSENNDVFFCVTRQEAEEFISENL